MTQQPRTPTTGRETLRKALIFWKKNDQPDKPMSVIEKWADWFLDQERADLVAQIEKALDDAPRDDNEATMIDPAEIYEVIAAIRSAAPVEP